MGAEPWGYFVPYRQDIQAALDELREQEFRAGRYWSPRGYEPGLPEPKTIEEAMEQAAEEGTKSILDMLTVGDRPDFATVAKLPDEVLMSLYGTDKPTRPMLESNQDFYEQIERGQGVYVIAYVGEQPHEIFFAGYSFD